MRRLVYIGICLAAFIFMSFPASPAGAVTFICNGVVFEEGDTKAEVRLACGEPNQIMWVGEVEQREFERGKFKKEMEPVEEWLYNCGPRYFMKILTFRGGRLVSVRNGNRGSEADAHDCW